MGKVKKLKPSQVGKNVGLADQIEASNAVKIKNRIKEKNRHDDDEDVSTKAHEVNKCATKNNTIKVLNIIFSLLTLTYQRKF